MCRPPANRSVAATSDLRQQGLVTLIVASSAFTCAVMAIRDMMPRRSGPGAPTIACTDPPWTSRPSDAHDLGVRRRQAQRVVPRRAVAGGQVGDHQVGAERVGPGRPDADRRRRSRCRPAPRPAAGSGRARPAARCAWRRENPAVSRAGSRLRARIRRARVAWMASASLGTSRCGMTEVNHDPGPSTIQSASSTTSTDSGQAGGSVGISRTARTSPVGLGHLGLTADLGDLVRARRVQADHVGLDLQRHRGHRQHPALGAAAAGPPCPARPPGRRAAPTARRSAGCRWRGRPAARRW